ncbi:MAG: polyphosphate kinase 1, partial [Spirochaetales bacterium]
QIQGACLFRVTRDADMNVDEERDEDFIAAMEEVLENRKSGFPVRLETQGNMETASRLREMLSLSPAGHFHLKGPLNLKSFFHLVFLPGFDHLRTPSPVPKPARELARNDDIWETLKNRDVLLHHPYETYTPVIRMVEEASDDPATIAIKMTLYRTSGDSPIVSALIRAAERGVQVTVLVELKARFDENANIGWAERLEKAGAIVVYGLAVLKVHAKAMMVVRKEKTGIFRYVHLGTGNYNDSTATLYTDMGLMSSREDYTRDTTLLFNAITGYSSEPHLSVLTMAPFSLRRETLRLIQREEQRAGSGEEARIVAKMNALTDPEIIEALYSASQQGVKIDLNVRGICCLKPGVPGLSENIRVISIIDMFLEHT